MQYIMLYLYNTETILFQKFYRFFQARGSAVSQEMTSEVHVKVAPGRPPFWYIFKKVCTLFIENYVSTVYL